MLSKKGCDKTLQMQSLSRSKYLALIVAAGESPAATVMLRSRTILETRASNRVEVAGRFAGVVAGLSLDSRCPISSAA